MRLLSWNIQQGGGARTDRIIDALVSHDPDVIALSEFRTEPGVPICNTLESRGWRYIESTNPVGRDNGLCVLSRTPAVRARPCPAPPENVARWLDVDFPRHGFGICVLHILCSVPKAKDGTPNEAKTRFWNVVQRTADERRHEPFLFVGDFNTGARGLDEIGRTFVCAEHFGKLSSSGWTDAWRHNHPGTTEWTWYSKFKGGARGNGFRIDHAFASPSLLPRVTSCWYSHTEREAKVSDHSLLVVEVA
jgi:exodeoxyribonuclease III